MTTNELDRLGLKNRTIREILVGPYESSLVLRTDDGDLIWLTDGDCCSTTWFSDINGLSALIDGEIWSASEDWHPAPEDGRTRQEFDNEGILTIVTHKGTSEIRYRNSSNGYYGGSIFWSMNEPCDLMEYLPVRFDWRAPGRGWNDPKEFWQERLV